MAVEPEVLLRSEVAWEDNAVKARLVSRILQDLREERLVEGQELFPHFSRLTHPGLPTQMASFLCDKSTPRLARQIGIRLGMEAKEKGLANVFADIALDKFEPYDLRVDAAHAVWQLKDDQVQRRLEPLAKGEAGDDPGDCLRGIGLFCMWPGYWSISELLQNLSTPAFATHGPYAQFVKWKAAKSISDDDLPYAFSVISNWDPWIKQQIWASLLFRFCRSWRHPALMEVVSPALCDYVWTVEKEEGTGIRGSLEDSLDHDKEGYRRIIARLVSSSNGDPSRLKRLADVNLVSEKDVPWILEEILRVPTEQQDWWAQLIEHHLSPRVVAESSDLIARTRTAVAALSIRTEWIFRVWDLNAPESRREKARFLWSERKRGWRRFRKAPLELTVHELERAENDSPDRWISVCWRMTGWKRYRNHRNLPTNLTKTPAWRSADCQLKRRICRAALSYLQTCKPPSKPWRADGSAARLERDWERAAYAAFLLLNNEEWLECLDPLWADWAETLVVFPWRFFPIDEIYDDWESDLKLEDELLKTLYSRAPGAFLTAVQTAVKDEEWDTVNKVRPCWSGALSNVIFHSLYSEVLSLDLYRGIHTICTLADLEPEKTTQYLLWRIHQSRGLRDKQQCLGLLIWLTNARNWREVWPMLQDPDFLTEETLRGHRIELKDPCFPATLPEPAIGEFYHHLCNRFAPWGPLDDQGAAWVDRSDAASYFRRLLLDDLTNRGTEESCETLRWLLSLWPQQRGLLLSRLRKAEENTRRASWKPLSAVQVLRLFERPDRQFIGSADQLMAMVMEALVRIENRLHGWHSPIWRFWNKEPTKPVSEDLMSNELAVALEEELRLGRVFVGREVTVTPRRGSREHFQPGQRLDILVQAFPEEASTRNSEALSVIVEVKGCWNRVLFDALETQLLDRYLVEGRCRHGIYVIGWFMCGAWEDSDNRKESVPNMGLSEVRRHFADTVARLRDAWPAYRLEALVLDLRLVRDQITT